MTEPDVPIQVSSPLDEHTLEQWPNYDLLKCPIDQMIVRYAGHHQWTCVCGVWQQSDSQASDHPALRYHLPHDDLKRRAEIKAINTVACYGIEKTQYAIGQRIISTAAEASDDAWAEWNAHTPHTFPTPPRRARYGVSKPKPRWDVHFAPALLPFAHIQNEVVGTF